MSTLMPFPDLTERMLASLVALALLARGGEAAAEVLATGEIPPRIWDITTIADPQLLDDTWTWLAAFVDWLNSQHAWYSADHTPACWPEHPGLVRELSTLAALRYQAGEATDPMPLEEWHRYALPSYLDRTRDQRRGCGEKHHPWPGRASAVRHAPVSMDLASRSGRGSGPHDIGPLGGPREPGSQTHSSSAHRSDELNDVSALLRRELREPRQ